MNKRESISYKFKCSIEKYKEFEKQIPYGCRFGYGAVESYDDIEEVDTGSPKLQKMLEQWLNDNNIKYRAKKEGIS